MQHVEFNDTFKMLLAIPLMAQAKVLFCFVFVCLVVSVLPVFAAILYEVMINYCCSCCSLKKLIFREKYFFNDDYFSHESQE